MQTKVYQSQSYGFSSSHVWMWELDYKESWELKNWCFWIVVLEKTLESLLFCRSNFCLQLDLQGDPTSPSRKSVLNIHWKDWCWSWNWNTLATWCEELPHWKTPWCWERLKVEGEGDDRVWDGWMVSLTQWTWVWASSETWWWAGKPGVLQTMGSQRVGRDWVTETNWTELNLGDCWWILLFLVAFNLVKFMSECIQWCTQGSSHRSCDSKSRVLPIKPAFRDTGPRDGGILSADEKGVCWVSRLMGCCFSKISLGAWNETRGFVLQLLWWWFCR